MNKLIRTGILAVVAFIGGTIGIAHSTAAHNTVSVHNVSALADALRYGFSWG